MIQKVRITVRGEQVYDGAEAVRTAQEICGTMERTDKSFRIVYDEAADSGLGATQTALDVAQDRVTLTRSGAVECVMIFAVGEKSAASYRTPQGTTQLEIATKSVRSRLSARGGVLEICYTLCLAGTICGEHTLKLRVQV